MGSTANPTPFEGVTFEEVTDNPEDDLDDEGETQDPDSQDDLESQNEDNQDQNQDDVPQEDEDTPDEEDDAQPENEEADDTDGDTEGGEEEESVSVIEALKSQTGIDTGKEYENDLNGAAEYINDAVEEQTQEAVSETLQSLPDDVQTYMQFRANGGDPEEFMQTFNSSWNETELREDDTDQHETIVRNRLREEGWSDEDIDEAVEDYKNSGVLYNEAKRSLNRLQDIEEQRQENLVEKQEKRAESQQEEIEQAWNEIEETLNDRSELNGLPVPESKKSDFFNWMSEPVDEVNGQPVSQRDKVAQEADVETLLTLDYVLYLMNDEDLSFSDVIDQKATSKKAEDLESLLSGSSDEDTPSDRSQGPSGDGSNDEVDVDSLPEATDLIS